MKNNNETYLQGDIFIGIKDNTEEYGETIKNTLYVGHDLFKCLKKLSRYSSGQKGEWGIGEYLILEQWRNGDKVQILEINNQRERQDLYSLIREYRLMNNMEK